MKKEYFLHCGGDVMHVQACLGAMKDGKVVFTTLDLL